MSTADRLRAAATALRTPIPGATGCTCPDGPPAWFDRSICPEPCGSMHYICETCGRIQDRCPVAAAEIPRSGYDLAVADSLEATAAMAATNDGRWRFDLALAIADQILPPTAKEALR